MFLEGPYIDDDSLSRNYVDVLRKSMPQAEAERLYQQFDECLGNQKVMVLREAER